MGRLTGLTFLGRLTVLTSVTSMEILTGKDRREGLCRLEVLDTHTKMTRMVSPTSRRMFIRG